MTIDDFIRELSQLKVHWQRYSSCIWEEGSHACPICVLANHKLDPPTPYCRNYAAAGNLLGLSDQDQVLIICASDGVIPEKQSIAKKIKHVRETILKAINAPNA